MAITWSIDGRRVHLGDDWEATINSSGGYDTLTATVNRSEVRHAHQGSHVSGHLGGQEVWFGELNSTPALSRLQQVHLTATGPVTRARRFRSNYLEQSRDYGMWQPQNSDPYAYAADDSIQTDVQGGRIVFRVTNGTDVTSGDKNGAVAWFPGEPISRIAFDWTLKAGTSNFALRVLTGTGPSGALTQRGSDQVSGAGASGSVSISPSVDDDLVCLRFVRTGANATTTANLALVITNLRVWGRSTADDLSPGEIMQDMGGALGWNTSQVHSSGQNGLPFYWEGGSWADAFDELSTQDDWPWGVYRKGRRGSLIYGPWEHKWTLDFSQENEDLDWPPIYNVVRVFYSTLAGSPKSVTLQASPDPLGRWGDTNEYQYDLSESYSSDDIPTAVAGALLEEVSKQKVVGSVTVNKVTKERTNIASSTLRYLIRPGQTARLKPYSELGPQRIVGVSLRPTDVQVQFGQDIEQVSAAKVLARVGHRRRR